MKQTNSSTEFPHNPKNHGMGQSSSVDAPSPARREISLRARGVFVGDRCQICTRQCRAQSPTQHTCDRCGIVWHAPGCGSELVMTPPLLVYDGWRGVEGRERTPNTINAYVEMEWRRASHCPLCKDRLVKQKLPFFNRWIYNDLEFERPWCKRCDINWFMFNQENFARILAGAIDE